jgi:hypothetical protein
MITLFVMAAAIPGPAPPVTVSPAGDVLPIRFTHRGMPLVQGRVDDQPVWLVLDTGATSSCLTTQAVGRLGLKSVGGKSSVTLVNGSQVEVGRHLAPSLWLGRTVFRGVEIPSGDLGAVSEVGAVLGIEVDGLLGGDLLGRLTAVIDYEAKTLRLAPRSAGDLSLLQGDWRAVDLERDGWSGDETYRQKVRQVCLTVTGDRMRMDMRPIGGLLAEQHIVLDVGYSPKRWGGRWLRFNNGPTKGLRSGQNGLYEVNREHLRLLFPASKQIPTELLPKTLTAAVPDSGLVLLTFERVPPVLGGWPDWLAGALVHGRVPDRPARLGGWEFAVTPDWALTASHAGRKQRVTARLDGSLTLQPLKP